MTSFMTPSDPKICQNFEYNSISIYPPYTRFTLAGTILLQQVEIYYRKISNIRRTKSQNLNNYRLVLQLSLPNPLKPGVKSRMKI